MKSHLLTFVLTLATSLISQNQGVKHFPEAQENVKTVQKKAAELVGRERRSVFPGPIRPDLCTDNPTASLTTSQRELYEDILLSVRRRELTTDLRRLSFHYAEVLAVNRGLFLSMALQFQNSSSDFRSQPGFLYYYVSAATGVTAAPQRVQGSGVFFDNHKHYPNWYNNVHFNQTIPLFAPRAVRQTTSELRVDDYGADVSTASYYTTNQNGRSDQDKVRVYTVTRQNVFGEDSTLQFFGPRANQLVTAGDPYNVCDGGNVAPRTAFLFPVVDVLPRYCAWTFLRKPWLVAAVSVELDLSELGTPGVDTEVRLFHYMLAPTLNCHYVPQPLGPNRTLNTGYFRMVYPQSRLALRLAHSLSAFLQIRGPLQQHMAHRDMTLYEGRWDDSFTQPLPLPPSFKIKLDAELSDVMLSAEVLANVLADSRILSSGIFFQYDVCMTSTCVSPPNPPRNHLAWRSAGRVKVKSLSPGVTNSALMMFRSKSEWRNAHVSPDLSSFSLHAGIRSNSSGGGLSPFDLDPLTFRAAPLGKGYWTSPYFKCDGYVDDWVLTYAAPFFAPASDRNSTLVFRGITTVDVKYTL